MPDARASVLGTLKRENKEVAAARLSIPCRPPDVAVPGQQDMPAQAPLSGLVPDSPAAGGSSHDMELCTETGSQAEPGSTHAPSQRGPSPVSSSGGQQPEHGWQQGTTSQQHSGQKRQRSSSPDPSEYYSPSFPWNGGFAGGAAAGTKLESPEVEFDIGEASGSDGEQAPKMDGLTDSAGPQAHSRKK